MTAQRGNGRRARSADMPAIAAAATLAGLAAGLTLGSGRARCALRLRRRRTTRDLADAARGAQSAACQMGELAAEIRKVREQAGSMNRRSPIEVVLQGLTRRPDR